MDMWKCHTTAKQLPIADEDSLIFWEGCRRGLLLIQQCCQCHTFRFPPSPVCTRCHSSWVRWQADPGQGEIVTFCTYYSDIAGPAWQQDVPYTVAVIRLRHSGVHFLSNVCCKKPQEVRIGLPVQVSFLVMSETITLPQFTLLEGDAVSVETPGSPGEPCAGEVEGCLTKICAPSILTAHFSKA